VWGGGNNWGKNWVRGNQTPMRHNRPILSGQGREAAWLNFVLGGPSCWPRRQSWAQSKKKNQKKTTEGEKSKNEEKRKRKDQKKGNQQIKEMKRLLKTKMGGEWIKNLGEWNKPIGKKGRGAKQNRETHTQKKIRLNTPGGT